MRGLAPAKAPGPDAYGAFPFLAALFAKMIELRVIPQELLEVHVVPVRMVPQLLFLVSFVLEPVLNLKLSS